MKIAKKYWKEYYTSETGKLKMQRWNGGGSGLRYKDGKFRVSTTGGGSAQKYPFVYEPICGNERGSNYDGPFYRIFGEYVDVYEWNRFYPDVEELEAADVDYYSNEKEMKNANADKKPATESIKDFIYKVDGSHTVKVESNAGSIDEFFNKDLFTAGDNLVLIAAKTNVTLITIEKVLINNKDKAYKFIVDIITDNNDEFKIKTTFTTQARFQELLESTINSLKEYKEFSKYAEDLNTCI